MANNNNNNDNSKRIIHLKKSQSLRQNGLVTDSIYYIDSHDVKISLNHAVNADIIFTIDLEKWQKNLDTIVEQAEDYGIYDNESKILLISHLNDNHEAILTAAAEFSNTNTAKDSDSNSNCDDDKHKHKRDFVTYKYSKMGKGSLHEAVIVNGLPFFVKYHHITNTFELVEKIEENNRILMPPNEENYPSSPPYSFESKDELAFFIQKAREVTLDQLFIFSKNIFFRYVDQDYYIVLLLAADAIWTYFQDLFPATHYGEGVGTNDVGKSSMGYTFENTGYRVVKATAISGANYYRVLGSIEPGQCVIIEDEGDSINEDPDKVKILKSGYEYNGKVPKINMNSANQEQKWYFAYCYKIILAEKSLKEYKVPGLVDRTFSFSFRPGNVKYSIKEVVSQNINKSPKLKKMYDELLCFRKLMLCYRLVHYQDLLTDIETGLKNRDEELCKPLLQLFYGSKALEKEIIPALEEFVRQRRIRKANSLEAALYPIIKKFVFSEVGFDYKTNTYAELKEKKMSVKVGFWRIWDYIKQGGINGQYEEKKKYQYETIDYGTLYLNSLPTTIRERFTATKKNEDYGVALIFDVEKLEKFENLYSDSHLKGDNVKIEVKVKTESKDEEETGDSGDSEDFGDFLGVRPNILEKNQQLQHVKDKIVSTGSNESVNESNPNYNFNNNIDTFQKSQESQESPESLVINNQEEEKDEI